MAYHLALRLHSTAAVVVPVATADTSIVAAVAATVVVVEDVCVSLACLVIVL